MEKKDVAAHMTAAFSISIVDYNDNFYFLIDLRCVGID